MDQDRLRRSAKQARGTMADQRAATAQVSAAALKDAALRSPMRPDGRRNVPIHQNRT